MSELLPFGEILMRFCYKYRKEFKELLFRNTAASIVFISCFGMLNQMAYFKALKNQDKKVPKGQKVNQSTYEDYWRVLGEFHQLASKSIQDAQHKFLL